MFHYESLKKNISRNTKYSNFSFEEFTRNVASIKVSLQMRQTIVSEEKKYELNDLIANVGGMLGLFLGFSLLSLAEIMEIFIQTLWIVIKKN